MNYAKIQKHLSSWWVIIVPTDTCYWFSCFYDSKEGISNIQIIKQRKQDKPFSLLFASIDQAKEFCEINENQEKFINNHLYKSSFIVKKKLNLVSGIKTQDSASLCSYFPSFNTVSIRIENDAYVFRPSGAFWKPLVTTSVNLSWNEILHDANDIKKEFEKYPFVHFLFFNKFKSWQASKIWDLTKEEYENIR